MICILPFRPHFLGEGVDCGWIYLPLCLAPYVDGHPHRRLHCLVQVRAPYQIDQIHVLFFVTLIMFFCRYCSVYTAFREVMKGKGTFLQAILYSVPIQIMLGTTYAWILYSPGDLVTRFPHEICLIVGFCTANLVVRILLNLKPCPPGCMHAYVLSVFV
jgi:hypothetical protein